MKIIDKTGKIYLCKAVFPLADPESGHTYQPGQLVKVDPNKWIDGQAVMVLQVEEKPAVEKAAAAKPTKA